MTTPEYEDLRKVISELQAQTHMICGEGYTVFNGLMDDIKESYLCSLVSKVDHAKTLVDKLNPSR